MFSTTCPHCHRVGSLKVAPRPGTKVRCPGCGEKFATPDDDGSGYLLEPDDTSGSTFAPFPSPLAPPASVPLPVTVAIPPSAAPDFLDASFFKPSPSVPSRAMMPPEPWYYRWLSVIGQSIFIMALIGEGFVILAALIIFVTSVFIGGQGDATTLGIGFGVGLGVGLAYVVWGLVILTPSVILALLLRLVVDAARNIRTMTYR